MERYQRQMIMGWMGRSGQERLGASHVLLVGCGAIGSAAAEQLVRAGVGRVSIADRDIVELSNLQRQVLFEESDAREALPKAVAAARRLGRINSTVHVEPLVKDVVASNIEELAQAADVIVDGTDNVRSRYVINDAAVKHGRPWVYGACVGAQGRVMAVRPGKTACLRCLFPDPPRAGELETCDTAGVLGPAAAVVGALQAVAAIKLLSGNESAVGGELVSIDFWTNRQSALASGAAPAAECRCCGRRVFDFLEAGDGEEAVSLCGRSTVQVRPPAGAATPDLAAARRRLSDHGTVAGGEFVVRCILRDPAGITLTLFADGRLLVHGTADPGRARSLYARFIGA